MQSVVVDGAANQWGKCGVCRKLEPEQARHAKKEVMEADNEVTVKTDCVNSNSRPLRSRRGQGLQHRHWLRRRSERARPVCSTVYHDGDRRGAAAGSMPRHSRYTKAPTRFSPPRSRIRRRRRARRSSDALRRHPCLTSCLSTWCKQANSENTSTILNRLATYIEKQESSSLARVRRHGLSSRSMRHRGEAS